MFAGRVDVHQHLIPPEYRSWRIESDPSAPGAPIPAWQASTAVDMMDRQGIQTGMVSVSTPGVHFGDDAVARRKAREVNEFAAELVKDRPDRFGFFATLTLPDVDGALAEAEYALDELGADGLVVLTNTRGVYLGDAAFDPLLDELGRRGAVVLVHPTDPPGPALPGVPPVVADYLLETTRVALNLVRSGATSRHPDLKVILCHGGGFVPYAAHRLAGGLSMGMGRTMDELLAEFRKFYFDTGLSASPTSMPSLLAFAEPGHVLYGSDWPYAPDAIVSYFTEHLETLADGTELAAINHGNAHALFPRLARPTSIA